MSGPTREEVETLVAHNKALIDRNAAMRERLEAAEAASARWQRNSRDTWAAMQAMRNDINEHVPMPSIESDLLQGPENSIFCAAVAEAVIAALTASRAREASAWDKAIDASVSACDQEGEALQSEGGRYSQAEGAFDCAHRIRALGRNPKEGV